MKTHEVGTCIQLRMRGWVGGEGMIFTNLKSTIKPLTDGFQMLPVFYSYATFDINTT